MRTENWYGYSIRFVETDDEWWAILDDVCEALDLKADEVSKRLDPNMIKIMDFSQETAVINELGVYQALFTSRKLEARKFRMWAGTVMKKLRQNVGLQQYEVMRITEPEIQEQIDWILDSLYWDEEKGCVMRSITVQGGDTDQIPFE